ncbi:MAG: DUF6677 family protein [Phycisphaerales bacterium]
MPIPQSSTPPAAAPYGPGAPAPHAPRHATPDHQPPTEFDPAAGLFAILLPGAGHFWAGERVRGLLIAAGVLGLFVGGMLIGGIDIIDRRENPIWFAGQALVGPVAFGVDYIHQNHVKVVQRMQDPRTGQVTESRRTPRPAYTDANGIPHNAEQRGPDGAPVPAAAGAPAGSGKSLGRMYELGTLYAAIAGMLNLIAVIDAAFRSRRAA